MVQVKIEFKSMKDVGTAYELFLKELNDAIVVNKHDPIKLEQIRQQLLDSTALVSNLQAELKYGHLNTSSTKEDESC